MTFASILFDGSRAGAPEEPPPVPVIFGDLNLDQVVEAVTAGYGDYDLTPFFNIPLHETVAVSYRQAVFRDLHSPAVRQAITDFAAKMATMRERIGLSRKLHDSRQRQRWHLDAVIGYSAAVARLAKDLSDAGPRSEGLLAFQAYLERYLATPAFAELGTWGTRLRAALGEVSYALHLKGNRITVRRYEREADYSADVTATFAKFAEGEVKDYRIGFSEPTDMNHIEAGLLALVAKLFGEVFADLADFYDRTQGYLDQTVARFDREIHFYLAYTEHIRQFRAAGLEFCYPVVAPGSKRVRASAAFDLALAGRLSAQGGGPVVRNDFHLDGAERTLVVTGPNQGGKTTLARTFGQLHYLASLGCPVPAASAELLLPDAIFTHFEQQEDLGNLSGKLADDLVRIREILDAAAGSSVIIMNEIFTSTALADATVLAREVMTRIIALDAVAVFVTFLDELASSGPTTVSMVATVDPDDPARRTFEVIRKPADGLAYAMSLAAQHGLTYQQLKERIAR